MERTGMPGKRTPTRKSEHLRAGGAILALIDRALFPSLT